MAWVLCAVVTLLFAHAAAQSIRTVNGTIQLEIPGATLALTGTGAGTGAGSGSSGNIATTNDLNAAIQTALSQTQPQINNLNSAVNAANVRVDNVQSGLLTLALNLSAQTVRAMQAENALNTQIIQEQLRATNAVANETTRATAAETSLAMRALSAENSAAALATSLAQSQSSLVQTQSTLAQTQLTLSQTQASVAAVQTSSNQAINNVLARLAAITNCTAQGLLPDANGTCVRAAPATVTPSSTCAANASTVPRCQPGFYPLTTSTSACTSDTPFPTTFTCQAVPCPPNSGGLNVPSTCLCSPGYIGNVTPSSVAPYFVSTCTPAPCPAFASGTNLVTGCTCNNALGFYGTGTLPLQMAPALFTNICTQFSSCRELLTQTAVPSVGRNSGVYYVNYPTVGVLPVLCDQTTSGGGWELVLKISSSAGNLFSYRAPIWNTGTPFNTNSLDETDNSALFQQFTAVQYTQVLAKFRAGANGFVWPVTSINPAVSTPSLNTIRGFFNYSGGYSFLTSPNGLGLGVTSNNPYNSLSYWAASATGLYPSGNFFSYEESGGACCQGGYHDFGINLCCGNACVRWGYIQNNEADCQTNDVAAGIGLGPGTPGGAIAGGEASAGDYYACCGKTGFNNHLYASIWGRRP